MDLLQLIVHPEEEIKVSVCSIKYQYQSCNKKKLDLSPVGRPWGLPQGRAECCVPQVSPFHVMSASRATQRHLHVFQP